MEKVIYQELGVMEYQPAWDYQESLLRENVRIKTEARVRLEQRALTGAGVGAVADGGEGADEGAAKAGAGTVEMEETTTHHLLFVEHPPVYTLGKSGHIGNVLLGEEAL